MMDFRFFFASLFSAVMGFLAPITDFMTAAALLFAVNFIFGFLAGVVAHEGFKWKKAFTFFVHCIYIHVWTLHAQPRGGYPVRVRCLLCRHIHIRHEYS